ncbi:MULTISPECIES: hypothetical protein [Clostridium]|uniref:Uncharacterized protein n=1 Tax=Clostridium carnis TaxID=1530 RepID=A0ABY6SZD0_9CLOT|nr:hypothetical protein [Clostridium carnis]CAI3582050.1 hypothetical protein CNEO3_170049 [Clostridium neonatale]CAI3585473.1 hypothetical protein CNEO3_10091 [Clostridium neonatale]CAI3614120.1 hypothetical protein CNEO3_200041 [Clostridium neonatale]CAI3629044.1 hypothetical protein CNEO3_280041 [Clostridium neonatale]CAI3683829.1 hypothetical protein CNEO3_90040 [Clostridium neonatale]
MEEINLGAIEFCKLLSDTEKYVKEINKGINGILLEGKIGAIKKQIIELEELVKENKGLIERNSKELTDLSDKYKDKKIEIISLTLKDVFTLISDNLPIGITGEIQDNKSLLLKKNEKIIKNNKEIQQVSEIGKVICENLDNNYFRLILEGKNIKTCNEEFKLDSLSRIFKIVACINNNILYSE